MSDWWTLIVFLPELLLIAVVLVIGFVEWVTGEDLFK
jgi:hypothetical protein